MRIIKKLKHNDNFKKRFRYLAETIITLPIGAITAFIFERQFLWALIALALFLILFLRYCVVVVVHDNKISVLSIMSEGLKDGRYEDVIKFGSAMSPTLFSSNKNTDRVQLGRLLFQACKELSQTEHSARDDIVIATGGTQKTVKQIKIELLLDDLGWSLYLTDHNSAEATANIQEAIKLARLEIKRIKNKNKVLSEKAGKQIETYMGLIMRGYRHLTGIYYSEQKTLDLAKNYERVTQFILSGGRILSVGGVCSSRVNGKNCGMICDKGDKKIICILNNIRDVYFSQEQLSKSIALADFVDIHRIKLNEADLIEDKDNFSNLLPSAKEKIIKEQCYAWSRNIVKWLQKNIHSSWDISFSVAYEMKEKPFISDDERSCKIAEAISFARLYYYGEKAFDITDYSDFETVISTELIRKDQQRYLTLLNEISLIDFNRKLLIDEDVHEALTANDTHNDLIEVVIDHIKQTRDACKGLRADLFARNTALLMKALLIRYNLNIRYNMGDESTQKYRMEVINSIITEVNSLYKEVANYEHCENDEVKQILDSVVKELKCATKELHKWKFVNASKNNTDPIAKCVEADFHCTYTDNPPSRIIEIIKERWNVS